MTADGDRPVVDLKTPNADFPVYLGDVRGCVMPRFVAGSPYL